MTPFSAEDSAWARSLHIVIPEARTPFDTDAARKMIELHRIAEALQRERAEELESQLKTERQLHKSERLMRRRWTGIAVAFMILSVALIVGMVVRR